MPGRVAGHARGHEGQEGSVMLPRAGTFHMYRGKVLVPIASDRTLSQEIHGIQQVDVSMHLGGSLGSMSLVLGMILGLPQSPQALSPCTKVVLLVPARSLEEFHEHRALLQSIKWSLEGLRQAFVSRPYPTEIVTDAELRKVFLRRAVAFRLLGVDPVNDRKDVHTRSASARGSDRLDRLA